MSGERRLSSNTLPRKRVALVQGRGALLWDAEGREYVDLCSQTMNLLLGQAHHSVVRAVQEQLELLTFIDQDFPHPIYERAMDALAPFLPQALSIFNFRMNDGSSAVECAVKMCRLHRNRSGIVRDTVLTFDGIYLGQNVQSLHLRGWGDSRREVLVGSHDTVLFAPVPRPDFSVPFEHAPAENGEAAAAMIRKHHDRLACVLIDPVMISSGVTMGRGMQHLLRVVTQEARRFGVPVVLDECQTFGWVPGGTMARTDGVHVDLLTLGKGVGGGLPLSICVARPEFDGLAWGDADYTNGGTLIAMAALLATIETVLQPETIQRVANLTALLDEFCSDLDLECEFATRGIGLIRAVQLLPGSAERAGAAAAARVADACLDRGVLVRRHADCVTLKPPVCIEPHELSRGLAVLRQALTAEQEAA